MGTVSQQPNKTDADSGSYGICRVIDGHRRLIGGVGDFDSTFS